MTGKGADKARKALIARAVTRVENAMDEISARGDAAVERFRKRHPRGALPEIPKGKSVTITLKAARQREIAIRLEHAQDEVRRTIGFKSWFFENREIVALGPQTENEHKLYLDPTGLSGAGEVIEAAKKGDRFARRALHNKLAGEIDEDFPIIGEYKKYLLWLLWNTREGKRRRGREPKLNHQRDDCICQAVEVALSFGFRLTRNRVSDGPSAASIVAEALAEFGIHMTEANVELIAKNVDLKKSEE